MTEALDLQAAPESEVAQLTGISSAEKVFIRQGVVDDCRVDGRRREEFRPITLQTNVVPTAFGSSRVRNEECDVICSITADLMTPSMDAPDEGKIYVAVDFASVLAADARLSLMNDDSAAFAQRLGHTLLQGPLNPCFIPREKLCVISKRFAWRICVDIMIMALGGSIVDLASYALVAALKETRFPSLKLVLETGGEGVEEEGLNELDGLVNDTFQMDEQRGADGLFDPHILSLVKQIDFQVDSKIGPKAKLFACADEVPIVLSMGQVEGHSFSDLTHEESLSVDSTISALITREGEVSGLRKHGGAPVTLSLITSLIPRMRTIGRILFAAVDNALAREKSGTNSFMDRY